MIILVFCAFWATDGICAASRTASTPTRIRQGTTTQQTRTKTTTARKATRVTPSQTKINARSAKNQNIAQRTAVSKSNSARSGMVIARSATSETRTGTEYEQCKSAYFACMDQFCQLKNDEYRRCSCSNRITSIQTARDKLQQASEQLVAFNENLDIVGKTAAQATAMNTASDGELALTDDTSASKALLTAIMNSIRGTDSKVENSKLSDLNSLDLSFDNANSFGTSDIGQTIASYNGQALYSAVYPQCRTAVQANCNDASLQRAVNAYLMAIEQDCNTVQTAINNKQKETHAAIRESSSMLDMARAENHKAHNSDDIATCLANVESAILSEEVCGANYHKCLDNGEYIDVSTGEPIAGVVDFYKLGQLLTFNSSRDNTNQKLAQNPANRTFLNTFEKRVKQFAEPALDKCYDDAETVWNDYLNKALLDIYYAQQSKVNEIQQGCFDFVSACYMNGSSAMTDAMKGLVTAQTTTLKPDTLNINSKLCSDYIASCNNMFDGEIVAQYIQNRHDTDSVTACRAVVKQCFDNYGGTNYENFYYPSSGLFAAGRAPDWFALYECSDQTCENHTYKSECAKQVAAIDACSDPEMVEKVFGGLNHYANNDSDIYSRYALQDSTGRLQSRLLRSTGVATEIYNQIIDILQTNCSNTAGKFMNVQNLGYYSANYNKDRFCQETFSNTNSKYKDIYEEYSIGKRYSPKLMALSGIAFASTNNSGSTTASNQSYSLLINSGPSANAYIGATAIQINSNNIYETVNENMCPRNYENDVDTQSWGACLCWENGGRRSNNGTSPRCTPSFPTKPFEAYTYTSSSSSNTYANYASKSILYGLNNSCSKSYATEVDLNNGSSTTYKSFEIWPYFSGSSLPTDQDWCTAATNNTGQVCPFGVETDSEGNCSVTIPAGWVAGCPNGYNYNSSTQECEPDTNNTNGSAFTTQYYCPQGYKLACPENRSASSQTSWDVFTFDTTTGKCTKSNNNNTYTAKCCPAASSASYVAYKYGGTVCFNDNTSTNTTTSTAINAKTIYSETEIESIMSHIPTN